MQAYLDRNQFGLAGLGATQQQDAATVATSLLASAKLATLIGGPSAGGIVAAAAGLAGYTLTTAGCQYANTVTATASVNPTMLILLAVAAYFVMKGGRL
jgi:hypothetical protein